jgi:hypothetical protein
MGTDQCLYIHIFGNKFELEKLRLDTINEVVRISLLRLDSTGVSDEVIQAAFRDLPQGSPMCQLIIDLHYRHLNSSRDQWFASHNCIPSLQGVWQNYVATCSQVVGDDHDHELLEKISSSRITAMRTMRRKVIARRSWRISRSASAVKS